MTQEVGKTGPKPPGHSHSRRNSLFTRKLLVAIYFPVIVQIGNFYFWVYQYRFIL
jgi:hypothetical protein